MRFVMERANAEAKHYWKQVGERLFAQAKTVEKFIEGEITEGQCLLRLADHETAICAAQRRYAIALLAEEQRKEAQMNAATSGV